MNLRTSIIFAVFLSGCASIPVTPGLPDIPPELSKPCGELMLLEGGSVTLSKLMTTVAHNYGLYHNCSLQHSSLVEWYQKQVEILKKIDK